MPRQYKLLTDYIQELKDIESNCDKSNGKRQKFLISHIVLCNEIKRIRLNRNSTHPQCAAEIGRSKLFKGIKATTIASVWNKSIVPCLTKNEIELYNRTSVGNYHRGTMRVHVSIDKIYG